MDTKTQQFLDLKSKVELINTRINTIAGERTAKEAQLAAILAKNGVKTIAELSAKVDAAKMSAAKVVAEATTFVEESSKKINDLDIAMAIG